MSGEWPHEWPQTDQASIPPRWRDGPPEYVLPEAYIRVEDADSKALTAFWRGSLFGAVLATGAFIASAAFSDTIMVGPAMIDTSTVTLEPSDEPGVAGVVTFHNQAVNGTGDNGVYSLSIPGLTVEARFVWESGLLTGADSIIVIPPEGMVCLPVSCEAEVLEGQTGRVLILEWLGS